MSNAAAVYAAALKDNHASLGTRGAFGLLTGTEYSLDFRVCALTLAVAAKQVRRITPYRVLIVYSLG
jgi:hypothetical protein